MAVWVLFGTAGTWSWLRYLTKKIEEIENILKKNNSQDAPEKKDIGGSSGDAIPNSDK